MSQTPPSSLSTDSSVSVASFQSAPSGVNESDPTSRRTDHPAVIPVVKSTSTPSQLPMGPTHDPTSLLEMDFKEVTDDGPYCLAAEDNTILDARREDGFSEEEEEIPHCAHVDDSWCCIEPHDPTSAVHCQTLYDHFDGNEVTHEDEEEEEENPDSWWCIEPHDPTSPVHRVQLLALISGPPAPPAPPQPFQDVDVDYGAPNWCAAEDEAEEQEAPQFP